eukprot:6210144-Karenia_brevis.AAC.1
MTWDHVDTTVATTRWTTLGQVWHHRQFGGHPILYANSYMDTIAEQHDTDDDENEEDDGHDDDVDE